MKRYCIVFCCCLLTILPSCSQKKGPSGLLNSAAALPDSFQFDQKGLTVLNTIFNDQAGTVSMLYGNIQAKEFSMDSSHHSSGARWALVTWKRVDDKHWFGANIPGQLLSLETLTMDSRTGVPPSAGYARYSGKDLAKETDPAPHSERIRYILHMQPAVMP